MTLSVAVMAHPKRAGFVDELLLQLPDAQVVWDRGRGRWDTGMRALLAYDEGARWHCVVQDDAIPCRDFTDGAALVANAAGDRPVGLYVGKVRPHAHYVSPAVRKALRVGSPWISGLGPLWGVAIIVPTAHIHLLVDWCERQGHIANYDRRIEAFYRAHRIDCWYPVPSLVDHRHVDENPSLIPGRGDNRQAHVFLGDRSPLDIDWAQPPIPIHGLTTEPVPHQPHVHEQRSQYMALRRYELTHGDDSVVVKLIDEAHVAAFRKAPGVVSVEPIDDESFESKPVTAGNDDDEDTQREDDDFGLGQDDDDDDDDDDAGEGEGEGVLSQPPDRRPLDEVLRDAEGEGLDVNVEANETVRQDAIAVDALSTDELIAVLDNDTDTYEHADYVVVPAAVDELKRRASDEADEAAEQALAEHELLDGGSPEQVPPADQPAPPSGGSEDDATVESTADVTPSGVDVSAPEPGDYSDLNQPALKAELDQRGIEYPGGPVKNDDLRALLIAADTGKQSDGSDPERDDDGEALA